MKITISLPHIASFLPYSTSTDFLLILISELLSPPQAQPAAPTHSLPLLPKNILLSLVTPNKQNKHKIPLPCSQSHNKSCSNIREILLPKKPCFTGDLMHETTIVGTQFPPLSHALLLLFLIVLLLRREFLFTIIPLSFRGAPVPTRHCVQDKLFSKGYNIHSSARMPLDNGERASAHPRLRRRALLDDDEDNYHAQARSFDTGAHQNG
jgi:hypothetical protein